MSNAPQHAHEISIELRWSDQDLLGHVNNAKLMTIAEEARIRCLGRLRSRMEWTGRLDMVLRTTQTDFLRPVMYEDHVNVLVWVSKIGNTSYTMQHEVHQNGKVCVNVEAVVVMFDSAKQAPMQIPEAVRAVLETMAE